MQRDSLMRLLDEGMKVKLTLLCAPAGYGKTTALSEWARHHGRQAAWVSLDKQDDDWVQFWNCVTASIQKLITGFSPSVQLLLEYGPSGSLVSPEPAIQAMLNELEQIDSEFAIILDDFHLIESRAIHKSLSYLLEHLPSSIHLYIASRTELPIPTARLLAKGQLQRITIQDLRFQPEEGLAFFRDMTDLSLTREQVARLYKQTEGWISGLQLAAISLKRSNNITDSIMKFNGHQHHISEYLLEEVFLHQPEETRTFLLRTSILSRINHSLCQAVTGQANCQEQLEKLEQAHLFIIPLDDQRNWFRYHHLLSDFLQTMFTRKGGEECAKAHVKAAKWLESHGFTEDAAEHYLAGKQYEDVVRLIENHLPLFLSKSTILTRWILQVPESLLAGRPFLELFYLNLMVGFRGLWGDIPLKVEQAKIRYEALQGQMNEAEWKEIMGNIYVLCALSCYIQKNLNLVGDYLIKADPYFSTHSLTHKLGHNKHFGLEEFDDHLGYINDHHEAAAFLQKMTNHYGPRSDHMYVPSMFASYGKLLYEWNRVDEAEDCLNQILAPNIKLSIPRVLFQVYIAAARIQQGKGHSVWAQKLIEQLNMQIDSPDYDIFIRKIEAEQACLAVRQGDTCSGHKWLQRCGMSHTDDLSLDNVFEHLALVNVLAACGFMEEALTLSEKLLHFLVKEGRLRDRIKILMLQSVIFYQLGQKEEALFKLEITLRLAHPEGFIRSFVDKGTVMAELLSEYLRTNKGSSAYMDYVRSLLHAFHGLQSKPNKAIQVQVSCFGPFKVTTEQGQEVKWRTAKTKEFMAYLVHHRGERVERDIILDSLWGDVAVNKAIGQLSTTVYYLRKNLNAIGLEDIVQHVNGSYRIRMEPLHCDYDECKQLLCADLPTDSDMLQNYKEQLVDIYKTGYLDRHDYRWAEASRSHLESEYTRKLLQLGEQYVQMQEYSTAINLLTKALECQPLNEDIYGKLIEAQLLAGDRISARKQYDALKRMLQSELGLTPKESIKKLLQQAGQEAD